MTMIMIVGPGEVMDKIQEFLKAQQLAKRDIEEFCRAYGATDLEFTGSTVTGVTAWAGEPPDSWKLRRFRNREAWTPVQEQRGRKIRQQMSRLVIPEMRQFSRSIGVPEILRSTGGLKFWLDFARFEIFDKTYFLFIPEPYTGGGFDGCREIKLSEYHALRGE